MLNKCEKKYDLELQLDPLMHALYSPDRISHESALRLFSFPKCHQNVINKYNLKA